MSKPKSTSFSFFLSHSLCWWNFFLPLSLSFSSFSCHLSFSFFCSLESESFKLHSLPFSSSPFIFLSPSCSLSIFLLPTSLPTSLLTSLWIHLESFLSSFRSCYFFPPSIPFLLLSFLHLPLGYLLHPIARIRTAFDISLHNSLSSNSWRYFSSYFYFNLAKFILSFDPLVII